MNEGVQSIELAVYSIHHRLDFIVAVYVVFHGQGAGQRSGERFDVMADSLSIGEGEVGSGAGQGLGDSPSDASPARHSKDQSGGVFEQHLCLRKLSPISRRALAGRTRNRVEAPPRILILVDLRRIDCSRLSSP